MNHHSPIGLLAAITRLIYDKESKVDVKDVNGVVIGQEARIKFKQSFGFGLDLRC